MPRVYTAIGTDIATIYVCIFRPLVGCGNLCSRTGLNGGTIHVRFGQRTNNSDIPSQ